jgi:hypothetical protein
MRGKVPQRADRRRGESRAGKGETVVQETTSTRGDPGGLANPTRSKAEQGTFEGCPPEFPGRPLEAVGNGGRREMVAPGTARRRDRIRLTGRLARL